MGRKRRVTTPWGLGELPLTRVENKSGFETKREYLARLEREEKQAAARAKEAAEKPLREAESEFSRNLVALRKSQAEALFIIPSEELQVTCSHIPDHVPGSIDEIRAEIQHAMTTGLAGTGITELGIVRVKQVASRNPEIDIRRPSNWSAIFEHMRNLDVFTSEELPQPAAPKIEPAVQPEPKTKMDDLMNLRVNGSRDLSAAKKLADDLYLDEVVPLYREWMDLIYRTWGYSITKEDGKIIADWFAKNNASWLRHESYNSCRRFLVSTGRWPRTMLLENELVAEMIEQTNLNDFDAKKKLLNSIRPNN